ncbi:hypothetical protein SAMN06295967_103225 [Belliella buryatensis]|uniref:Uncharacterized protein n=1 Tax=Belliella buryatensis TaxID=1500549 RepID=A0A239BT27_9BACT|nr:hypothetical protein SAMN06295967_103225 [Belliella buryatensis]
MLHKVKRKAPLQTYHLFNHSKHDYITEESKDIIELNFKEAKISGKFFLDFTDIH